MGSQAQANLKGSIRLGGYLRKLRTGYGYSLRRVEERARAEGGEIDNSQLSRYEKGICYPSFDKLRILATVFNVSIQSFADVVDLEAYEDLRPEGGEPAQLIEHAIEKMRSGDNGHAFAILECAIELLAHESGAPADRELIGRARINQAIALSRLGKLSLAEQELRQALRIAEGLTPVLKAKALVLLSGIHADQGDYFLGEMEAERAYETARELEEHKIAADALNNLARVHYDLGHYEQAIERFRHSAQLHEVNGDNYEATRVRTNIGACYVGLGKTREGLRMLRESLGAAREHGYRRLAAAAWNGMGEAYFRIGDSRRARACFRESDALAVYNNEKHPDILFSNAYYEWKMALDEDNPTREKIAFGRLKLLRPSLERKLREVEDFDSYVERGRHDA